MSAIIPPPQTQSIVGKNAFDYFFSSRPSRQSHCRKVNNNKKIAQWMGAKKNSGEVSLNVGIFKFILA